MFQKILLIDNYDSFTYNLVHYLERFDIDVTVVKNDVLQSINIDLYDKILISPGPGLPSESGELMAFLKKYITTQSILGICLGHQALGELFGCKLTNLDHVQHGVCMRINHFDNDTLYKNIPKSFNVGLYHSWHLEELSSELIPTAISETGVIMSFKHQTLDIKGIQYHPESIMTDYGLQIVENWLEN